MDFNRRVDGVISGVSIDSGRVRPVVDKKRFMNDLKTALKFGEVILLSKPDKYRGVGKTSLLTNFVDFTEDTFIIIPPSRQNIYEEYLSKDKIVVFRSPEQIRGIGGGRYIMDEVSFGDYLKIKEVLSCVQNATLSGLVSTYEDYLVL